MFVIIFAIAFFLYAIQMTFAIIGLYQKPRLAVWLELPQVSLVVAARNEEANIGRCLDSLVAVDYPHDRLEIIICDGASEDSTCSIVQDYLGKFPFVRLHHADQTRRIKGKGNQIHQAVEIATGEIIFMTDADCTVQPTWVKDTLKYFRPNVGLVAGFTVPHGNSLFDKIQTLDWCFLLSLIGGLFSTGFPLAAFGNNFCFRKKAYEDVGGYDNLAFSITEDYTLFNAILKSTQWKVLFPLNPLTVNTTEPVLTLHDLYHQKKRWTLGALHASAFSISTSVIMLLTHTILLLGFAFLSLDLALSGLAMKLIFDFALMCTAIYRFQKGRALSAFLVWELYWAVFVFFAPCIFVMARSVVWKGVTYQVR